MQVTIRHTTRYDYEQPVDYGLQKVRLRPVSSPLQQVISWDLEVEGGKVELGYTDHFGNLVHLVSTEGGARHMSITASGTVDTEDKAGVLGTVFGRAPLWLFRRPTDLTKPGPQIEALVPAVAGEATTLDGLHALSASVLRAVPYLTGQTESITAAEEAMTIGSGVCQDHANIFVSAARAAGLPARYVSGYLLMDDRVEQEASHAWAEVYLDDLGWTGFDVSNGICPDPRYVRIAIGRDSQEAAPISGLRMGAGGESLIVSLQVQQ